MASRPGRGGAQTQTFGAASMDLPTGRRGGHGLSLVPWQVPTSGFVFGSLSVSKAPTPAPRDVRSTTATNSSASGFGITALKPYSGSKMK
jgi:hypothetical protein